MRGYRNGKTFSRLFSDMKCGGTDNALKQAKEFRDELFNELSTIPKRPRNRRIVTKDSRNTTGVLGVCRTAKRSPNGTVNECYSVSWRPAPGVQKCTSFSIRKYGEKKAFQLAVEHRKKMMEQVYGSRILEKIESGEKVTVPYDYQPEKK